MLFVNRNLLCSMPRMNLSFGLLKISTGTRNGFSTLSNMSALKKNTILCRKFPNSMYNTPKKSSKLAPFNNPQGLGSPSDAGLIKPLIFTLSFTAGSFIAVSIWEYENIRARAKRAVNFSWFKNDTHPKKPQWRQEIETLWNKLSPGEKVFVPILIANVIVFGLWRIPRMQTTMLKYFCSNPVAKAVCWPMFLSSFSHYSLFHIFANMYVLYSFSNISVAALGKEQFVGLYLSGGVIAAFTSYLYKVGTYQSGFSLGASGAIMAILALVCTSFPDTRLSILFIPGFTFSAGDAIKVIMSIDFLGCLLRWRFLDHAAHLGGAFFGLFWHFIGSPLMWPQRDQVHKYWHQIRSPKTTR